MDVKEKTKDNMKARMNIPLFCHCKNVELVYDGSRVAKPKANFTLNKNAQLLIYQWLKGLCFLDGYASNISRLVNLEDVKLYKMKSHVVTCLCKHSFHLITRIYCEKGYGIHSRRLVIFLEIYALTSCITKTWRSLKLILSRQSTNLRWYSLNPSLTQQSIYPYIYYLRKSWRSCLVQINVSIQEVRDTHES